MGDGNMDLNAKKKWAIIMIAHLRKSLVNLVSA